jgi:hypothetical protein
MRLHPSSSLEVVVPDVKTSITMMNELLLQTFFSLIKINNQVIVSELYGTKGFLRRLAETNRSSSLLGAFDLLVVFDLAIPWPAPNRNGPDCFPSGARHRQTIKMSDDGSFF